MDASGYQIFLSINDLVWSIPGPLSALYLLRQDLIITLLKKLKKKYRTYFRSGETCFLKRFNARRIFRRDTFRKDYFFVFSDP